MRGRRADPLPVRLNDFFREALTASEDQLENQETVVCMPKGYTEENSRNMHGYRRLEVRKSEDDKEARSR